MYNKRQTNWKCNKRKKRKKRKNELKLQEAQEAQEAQKIKSKIRCRESETTEQPNDKEKAQQTHASHQSLYSKCCTHSFYLHEKCMKNTTYTTYTLRILHV